MPNDKLPSISEYFANNEPNYCPILAEELEEELSAFYGKTLKLKQKHRFTSKRIQKKLKKS